MLLMSSHNLLSSIVMLKCIQKNLNRKGNGQFVVALEARERKKTFLFFVFF